MLTDLVSDGREQKSLWRLDLPDSPKSHNAQNAASRRRMAMLDQVNAAMGRGTLFHASEGVMPSRNINAPAKSSWQMRQQFRSPSYTTRWNDLVKVR